MATTRLLDVIAELKPNESKEEVEKRLSDAAQTDPDFENPVDNHGMTLLMHAVRHRNLHAVKWIKAKQDSWMRNL